MLSYTFHIPKVGEGSLTKYWPFHLQLRLAISFMAQLVGLVSGLA